MLGKSLEGLLVLDFGQLIAAPVCAMWLADLGATVIKVEPPGGELARRLGPPSRNGESFVSLVSNRNKLGLGLDLKHPRARAVMARAGARADVVVQNFRPGVAARLGIGYPELSAVNPDLVYCAISAYGQTGPWHHRPGVDGIIQAASGIMSAMGSPDGGPGKVPLPLADMTGALFALIAIQGALRNRDAGRGGAFLDIDLLSGMLMLQQLDLAAYLTNGELPAVTGNAASYAAPNEAFPTADGWIMVAAYQPPRWAALCRALGRPELEGDGRFASNALRVANRAALHAVLDPLFARRPAADWAERLSQAGIMATPVASHADVVASPAYRAGDVEVTTVHPVAGPVRMPGFAFGGCTRRPQTPAPRVGEHSRRALQLLDFSQHDIDALVGEGVVMEGETV
ncbi:CaiB/BaiF CoA transferase family protein [Azospirillum sp. ST 5-10]|uniref:CaiB/BaiF CoA transferase family protein n=1 Tax=unclassified Azospirillum TaxID=2630922 RepID=UPI003F4A4346